MKRSLCAALVATAAGCTGVIGDVPNEPPGSAPEDGELTACEPGLLEVGPSPTRRLTRDEYANTLHDLLGLSVPSVALLEPDDVQGGFYSNSVHVVGVLHAERYAEIAAEAARLASGALDRLSPCAPSGPGDLECARAFISAFGRRAYRRALAPAEIDGLLELFRLGAESQRFADGARLVLEAMLQSPHLLYRFERGRAAAADGEPVLLTGYEMATRLAYLLWASAPDDTLLDAAEADALQTEEQVAAQVERMLQDPRARRGLGSFLDQWLLTGAVREVQRSTEAFPRWSPELGAAMADELAAFVRWVVWESDARLSTLLTSTTAFVDPALAELYGVEHAGSEVVQVSLPSGERAGLLTRAGVLAALAKMSQSAPILRGHFAAKQLLCFAPPPPGDEVDTFVPDIDPEKTTRERFAEHSSKPACAGCHQYMDPVGFGLEAYDGIGAFRTHENGLEVDSSGTLVGTDVDGAFVGGVELSHKLASSRQVHDCVTEQTLRFALGRELRRIDRCSLGRLQADFVASGGDLRALWTSLARSDAIRFIAADSSKGEQTP